MSQLPPISARLRNCLKVYWDTSEITAEMCCKVEYSRFNKMRNVGVTTMHELFILQEYLRVVEPEIEIFEMEREDPRILRKEAICEYCENYGVPFTAKHFDMTDQNVRVLYKNHRGFTFRLEKADPKYSKCKECGKSTGKRQAKFCSSECRNKKSIEKGRQFAEMIMNGSTLRSLGKVFYPSSSNFASYPTPFLNMYYKTIPKEKENEIREKIRENFKATMGRKMIGNTNGNHRK